MTKIDRIDTYSELLEEKERLLALASVQRGLLRQDIAELKDEFKPLRKAVNMVGRFFKADRTNPILSLGTNKIIDLVIRRGILGKAGWVAKLVVPFLVKNYSSHVVDEKKGKLAGWAAGILRKFQRKIKGDSNTNPPEWEGLDEQEASLK